MEEADVYEFLTLLQTGKMALHSDYPYIKDVLDKSAIFVPKTSAVAFSFPNGHKYLTSLTDLQQEQANFLNKNVKKLRGCKTIQSWERNLRHSANTTRKKYVILECPFHDNLFVAIIKIVRKLFFKKQIHWL